MFTATKARSQEKTGTWANIFPTEQVSEQQSVLFVKKLLAVAVSNITYLRAIFPEHAFGDRSLEDLHLKILRDDSTCPGAGQVIKWVKGCFDALDKKYLRMLIIGIFVDANDPDTVIESYTFKFSYTENGGIDIYRNDQQISSAYNAAETKKATIRMLRTIVVLTQSLQSLPDDVMMTMKLLYYDQNTPPEYEPPGFAAAETESFSFEEDPMNIKIGDVSTPFHTVKLRIKTDAKQFEPEGNAESTHIQQGQKISNVGLDQDTDLAMEEESIAVDVRVIDDIDEVGDEMMEPAEADTVPSMTPAKPGIDDQAVSRIESQSSAGQSQQDEFGVRCPCGNNEDDGLMILCAECKKWQHGVCFTILREEQAPVKHICDACGNVDNPDLLPTDQSLHNLTEVAVQARCLWRRALLACTETNRILPTNLARRLGVEMTVAAGLVNRLEKEGYLKLSKKGKRLGKVVDKEKLTTEGMVKYFQLEGQDDAQRSTNQDVEIEDLTNKAEKIDISGKQKKKRCSPIQESEKKEENPKRGKKRVKSREDFEEEFEVCNSQEESQDIQYPSGSQQGRPKKRRKTSIAKRSILV